MSTRTRKSVEELLALSGIGKGLLKDRRKAKPPRHQIIGVGPYGEVRRKRGRR